MGERAGLRIVRAANPAPLTLDGTRTYVVGRDPAAVIDPGPDLPGHLDAVADLIGGGVRVSILLTHDHPDHAAGADGLAARLGQSPIRSVTHGTLAEGDRIDTDAGQLIALRTPGHAADHVAFHWPAGDAVFVGDLMLGGMDTALVAPPEGDLGQYLDSLERVRALGVAALYPTHGEPFDHPATAIRRYVAHRHERLERVAAALRDAGNGGATLERVVDAVYGASIDAALRPAAAAATRAYLAWLEARGRASRRADGAWQA